MKTYSKKLNINLISSVIISVISVGLPEYWRIMGTMSWIVVLISTWHWHITWHPSSSFAVHIADFQLHFHNNCWKTDYHMSALLSFMWYMIEYCIDFHFSTMGDCLYKLFQCRLQWLTCMITVLPRGEIIFWAINGHNLSNSISAQHKPYLQHCSWSRTRGSVLIIKPINFHQHSLKAYTGIQIGYWCGWNWQVVI